MKNKGTLRSWTSLEKWAALLVFGNVLMRLIIAATLPITYKEAYFWEWSLFPSMGYLDHPPMIAWMLNLASLPFDHATVLTVRAVPLILGAASIWLLYRLARQLFNADVAARAVIIAVCTPVLTATWMLALPDTPLLFFQLLAFNIVADIANDNRPVRWLALGIVIGCAILSKLAIGLTLVAALLFVVATPAARIRLRDLALASAAAAAVSAPYWLWNIATHWRAVELQGWERHFYDFGFTLGKFGEVWFEQVAAASPLLLPLLVGVLFFAGRQLPPEWKLAFRALRWQAVLVGGAVIVAGSFITQTHPHWAILAYPPAVLALAVVWSTQPAHRLVTRLSGYIIALACVGAVAVVVIGVAPHIVNHVNPEWLTPQLGRGLVKGKERLLGYGELAQQVKRIGEEQGFNADTHVFTDSYHFGAPLSFALQNGPVICLDAYARKHPLMGHAQQLYLSKDKITNASGLYIARGDRPDIEAKLKAHFRSVTPLPPIDQTFAGEVVARYTVFRVDGLHVQ